MYKKRRLFMRTETSERVLIRQKRGGPSRPRDPEGSIGRSLPDAKYRLEICSIDAGCTKIVFEREFAGAIEVIEMDETFEEG